ncbi:MAG: hypothetical protein J6D16_00045 [Clostridia bacterium]|nr:hypothetical protein [Clostridia bacterium]
MSKSNNNHCTPDLVGEQKGDSSPFFHIPSREELLALLLKERKDISFFSEDDLIQLSSFFHSEARDTFLRNATDELKKRQTITVDARARILELSEKMVLLARRISAPPKEGIPLSKACATLTEHIDEQKQFIHTNIIFSLNNKMLFLKDNNSFFQMERKILLLEIAQKALEILPNDWEITRHKLLSHSPKEQLPMLSTAIDCCNSVEERLASDLVLAAKAAKVKNAERYSNILHKTAMYLYDTAVLLKSIERKEV